MANFFDQFDQPSGDKNFFDQFDAPSQKRETGFTGAAKSTIERIKGETALTAGKLGLMDIPAAEQYAAQQEAKARQIFQPTQEGWTEAPVTKFKELLGGSLPYTAIPLAAAGAAAALPATATVGGIGAATLAGLGAGTAQYIGSGLSTQMETGKSLADTSLLKAGAAAFGEALLDRVSFGVLPGVRKIFQTAGKEVGEDVIKEVAKKGIMSSAGELALSGFKGATVEGATEAAQEFLNRLQAGLSLKDKAARDAYFDNFIGGAVLGGAFAVPGHITEKAFAKKPPTPGAPSEEAAPPKAAEIYPTAEPVTMAGLAPLEEPLPPMPIPEREKPTVAASETAVAPIPTAVEQAPVEAPVEPIAAAPEPIKPEPTIVPISEPITPLTQKVEPPPSATKVPTVDLSTRLQEPEVQASLKRYAAEAGWAEAGGRMIREVADDYSSPVIGRTQWTPNAAWWPDRPVNLKGDMNGRATQAAVNKALAGEKLKPNEKKMIDFLVNMHDSDMVEGDRIRAEMEARDREAADFMKQFQNQETPEQAAARTEQEAAARKAQEDAEIQAEMDAKAEAYKQEIARRSQEQAGTFALGQTPMESLTGQQRMDEDIPFERATPYADKFIAEEKQLAENLRKSLDAMGLKNVGLNLVERLYEIREGKPQDVNGYYFQKMLNLSLSGDNIFRTMNHEALHAMKDLGFFTDAEWKLLEDKARSTWMDKYNIARDYGDKSETIQLEEAIAKAFADKNTQEPKVRSIMDKAINLLKRIGNVLRGRGFTSAEDILGKAAEGKLKPTVAEQAGELRAERTYSNAPPKTFTKVAPQKTAGEKLQDINKNIQNAWNDSDYWTKLRNEWIDPSSGLTKSLKNLPVFDSNGQLRADMLNHSAAQSINLIKNGLLTGMPVINKDGSIIIDESDNNLARTQTIADSIDNNTFVKNSGLSGRGFVAEVARALRGKEIMEEDAARRKFGAEQLQEAKDIIKQVKEARDEGKSVSYIRTLLKRAAALRKQGYENKNMKRELQVDQAQIDWAEKQLKDVPEVKEILDIWKKVNDSLVNLWLDVGLLTKDQADNYLSKKSYVPLFKSREDLSDQPTGYSGGTGLKTPKSLKRLKGADIDRNIWENVEKHYASMIAAAYQNQTRKVGTNQLKSLGLATISTADDPDVNLRYRDPSNEFADNQGVVHAIIENPNDLAAFQMMHYELGPVMKAMAGANQVLRAGALLNPMFWIKQLIRDPVHATLVTDSGIVTPFHAAKGYIDVLRGDSREAGILARAGVIGQMDSTIDIHDFLKQVGMEKKAPTVLHKALHKAMKFHEASDAATRVALFKDQEKKALAMGMSPEDAVNYAVFKARESINFAIHGTSPILNNLRNMIPFLSATINSLDTVYRAATGYGLAPAEKKAAQMLFVKRAVMMSMLATVYAMMYQGDEDYKKLPDYTKDHNFLFPNPFGDGHTFIKVPVPFEVGFLFKTVPEATVRYMAGNSTGKEVLASYLTGITNTIPGNGVPLPQLAKPAFEVITNHSFFTHRPIESVGEQNLPVAMRGARATEVAKQLSALGLDKIGLSPAKIDYLIQGYTAELGSFTTNLASSAVDLATGTERTAKNIEEMPFFKSFMTNPKASKAIADFYDLAHNAQETVNEFNQYKKFGETERIKELMANEENRKLIAAAPSLRAIQSQMTNLRTQMKMIDQNQRMNPEERRIRLNELQTVYERLALQGEQLATAMKIER